MDKPVYNHSKVLYIISAILTVPLLIDICCACHLFSLWIAWLLFTLIGIVSLIRLVHAFRQKCYKFAFGLIGQLALGALVLTFFQLSYTNVIETPVSHPITPAVVNIAPPPVLDHDSIVPEKHDSVEHKTSIDSLEHDKEKKKPIIKHQ